MPLWSWKPNGKHNDDDLWTPQHCAQQQCHSPLAACDRGTKRKWIAPCALHWWEAFWQTNSLRLSSLTTQSWWNPQWQSPLKVQSSDKDSVCLEKSLWVIWNFCSHSMQQPRTESQISQTTWRGCEHILCQKQTARENTQSQSTVHECHREEHEEPKQLPYHHHLTSHLSLGFKVMIVDPVHSPVISHEMSQDLGSGPPKRGPILCSLSHKGLQPCACHCWVSFFSHFLAMHYLPDNLLLTNLFFNQRIPCISWVII